MKAFNDDDDKVTFRIFRIPFFLEPGYMDRSDDFTESHDTRMIRKFGSKEAFERVKKSHGLIPRGAEVGLDGSVGFTQENLSKRVQSSTLKSQRLVYWVARHYSLEKCEALYSVLNRQHFIEGGVLNDNAVLLKACEEAGIATGDVEQFLDSEKYKHEVMQMYQNVLESGIDSIPTIIIQGQYVVNGAAGKEQYLQVFNQLVQENEDGEEDGDDVLVNKTLFFR